jgi:acetylornithine/N-succinyldiaminopimelate aminotransferase
MSHVLECSGYSIVKNDIFKTKDCYLYDSQKRKYIDFEAGVWCTSLGHSNDKINHVIKEQVDRIIHLGFRYTNDIVEKAALKVLETTTFNEGKCIFLSSGSEAVEFGVQIARLITKKTLLMTLSGSYLSAYGSSGKKSNKEWYIFDWEKCMSCTYKKYCNPECPLLKKIPFEKIGGFVFESGCAGGLIKFPPMQLVRAFETGIKLNRGLIVVDEVTTGMGRTGTWYGFEHYNMHPDIISLGKGIGNGYPVSAVAMSKKIANALEREGFHYAQSHQNNALGCAIVKEVIQSIQDKRLVEKSKKIGDILINNLKTLQEKHSCIKEVRGRGLMVGVEFKNNCDGFSLETIYHKMIERGFIIGYKPVANLFRFLPALVIKEKDIENMLRNLEEILETV